MLLEKYPVRVSEDYMNFVFDSVGPKGIIRKAVLYSVFGTWEGVSVYNLAFGDWRDGLEGIDDSIVSNNGDRDKVLVTVASTILDFSRQYGRVAVFAKGATPSRTRLYQMAINTHLTEIENFFRVYGIHEGIICPFEQGVNYESFFVVKK